MLLERRAALRWFSVLSLTPVAVWPLPSTHPGSEQPPARRLSEKARCKSLWLSHLKRVKPCSFVRKEDGLLARASAVLGPAALGPAVLGPAVLGPVVLGPVVLGPAVLGC